MYKLRGNDTIHFVARSLDDKKRNQGWIQEFGKGGGSDKYIQNWGEVREGACPSRDSKGVWGSADRPPPLPPQVGKPQPLFCFYVYLA